MSTRTNSRRSSLTPCAPGSRRDASCSPSRLGELGPCRAITHRLITPATKGRGVHHASGRSGHHAHAEVVLRRPDDPSRRSVDVLLAMSLFPALLLAISLLGLVGEYPGLTTRSSAICEMSSRRRCSSRSISRCGVRFGRRARRRRRSSSVSCWRSTARPACSRRRAAR